MISIFHFSNPMTRSLMTLMSERCVEKPVTSRPQGVSWGKESNSAPSRSGFQSIGGDKRPSQNGNSARVETDEGGHKRSKKATPLTEAEFDRNVMQSKRPAIVYLTADWCGPCHRLRPVLEGVGGEYGERISFFSMDYDKLSEGFRKKLLGHRPVIKGPPLVILYKAGKVLGTGVYSIASIEEIKSGVESPATRSLNRKLIESLIQKAF